MSDNESDSSGEELEDFKSLEELNRILNDMELSAPLDESWPSTSGQRRPGISAPPTSPTSGNMRMYRERETGMPEVNRREHDISLFSGQDTNQGGRGSPERGRSRTRSRRQTQAMESKGKKRKTSSPDIYSRRSLPSVGHIEGPPTSPIRTDVPSNAHNGVQQFGPYQETGNWRQTNFASRLGQLSGQNERGFRRQSPYVAQGRDNRLERWRRLEEYQRENVAQTMRGNAPQNIPFQRRRRRDQLATGSRPLSQRRSSRSSDSEIEDLTERMNRRFSIDEPMASASRSSMGGRHLERRFRTSGTGGAPSPTSSQGDSDSWIYGPKEPSDSSDFDGSENVAQTMQSYAPQRIPFPRPEQMNQSARSSRRRWKPRRGSRSSDSSIEDLTERLNRQLSIDEPMASTSASRSQMGGRHLERRFRTSGTGGASSPTSSQGDSDSWIYGRPEQSDSSDFD